MMQIISVGCVLLMSTLINDGTASTTTLIRTPNLDTSIVRSHQTDNSFGYSIQYRQAYTPLIQPLYTQSIIAQPLYTYQYPYPVYPSNNPGLSQYPIFGGQNPFQQIPIQVGGIAGIPGIIGGGGGVVRPPVQQNPFPIGGVGIPGIGGAGSAPPGLSPTPVEGTVLDEDTVAVEAP